MFCDVGGASQLRAVIPVSCISRPVGCCSSQLEVLLSSVVKLQRWWKRLLFLKLTDKSAIIIQSCARGWIARRKANIYRHHIVVIQVWYSNNCLFVSCVWFAFLYVCSYVLLKALSFPERCCSGDPEIY